MLICIVNLDGHINFRPALLKVTYVMKTSNQIGIALSIVIVSSVLTSAFGLYIFKEHLIESRKREISTILHFANAQASIYVEKHKDGLMSREEAEDEAVKALSKMNMGSHYIWANDHHAIARVHARPEIIGQFQTSYIHHMALLKSKVIAFHTETNIKPITNKRVMKINGISKLPQWDWVIGYGAYMDDIESDFLDAAAISFAVNLLIVIISIFIAVSVSRAEPNRREH